jgi:hypothetical protein
VNKIFQSSFIELNANWKKYRSYFLLFLALSLWDTFFDLYGGKRDDVINIISDISQMFLSAGLTAFLINKLRRDSIKVKFIYYFVPFLLYSLYYSFFFLGGIILFVLPGLYILGHFTYVPMLAIIGEADRPFQMSKLMAKKNMTFTYVLSLITLVLELLPYGIKIIKNDLIKLLISFMMAPLLSYIFLLITISGMEFYYQVKEDLK